MAKSYIYAAIAATCLVGACAPVKHLQRPDPVDLDQFAVGDKRAKVITALGEPVSKIDAAGAQCDIYKLFTRGPGRAGRVAIAATQAFADVMTLGLAELVTNPVENATKATPHRVTFCYERGDVLVSVRDQGVPMDENPHSAFTTVKTESGQDTIQNGGALFDEQPGAPTSTPKPADPNVLFPEATAP